MFLCLPNAPLLTILVLPFTRFRIPGPFLAESTVPEETNCHSRDHEARGLIQSEASLPSSTQTDRKPYPQPAESCTQSHAVHFNIKMRFTSSSPKLFFFGISEWFIKIIVSNMHDTRYIHFVVLKFISVTFHEE